MTVSAPASTILLRGTGIAISVRLDYILFPIKFEALREALASNGYVIEVPRGLRLPIGTEITLTGTIAKKRDVTITLDSERQVLIAEGKVLSEVVSIFSELEAIVETALRVAVTTKARFYEIIANYEVETGKNPLDQISKIQLPDKLAKGFEEVLGAPATSYTLRVSPVGQVPDQEDWFDVRIEPLVFRATDTYMVNIIYRSKDKSKFLDFISQLEAKIRLILGLIES
jgi:hypothetical protein